MDSFLINEHPRQIHIQRRKDIIRRYPEVKSLFGAYPLSVVFIAGLVLAQWALAWLLCDQPWYGFACGLFGEPS
jgi:hypothetical protein